MCGGGASKVASSLPSAVMEPVHGDEVAGFYETEGDAISEGYRRYGNVPFLVKQVVEVEIPECFVSNLLAL